jgi:hypothetical protein
VPVYFLICRWYNKKGIVDMEKAGLVLTHLLLLSVIVTVIGFVWIDVSDLDSFLGFRT